MSPEEVAAMAAELDVHPGWVRLFVEAHERAARLKAAGLVPVVPKPNPELDALIEQHLSGPLYGRGNR